MADVTRLEKAEVGIWELGSQIGDSQCLLLEGYKTLKLTTSRSLQYI